MKSQPSTGMQIGMSLSGGGFRATVFHLGVLARLAEEGHLEDVAVLSTVSGGTLCIGLVYAHNDFRWPTSSEFVNQVLPQARKLLTSEGLQSKMAWRVLRVPSRVFGTRADDLSLLLRQHWGITCRLSALPERPRWMINATCYETGKNWRFERSRMGDYVFGYTQDTGIPLSDALAASAAFPGLIGALKLDTRSRSWFKYVYGGDRAADQPVPAAQERATEPATPAYSRVHLWDGGVYDNLGLESLHHFEEGWREDVDFLIVSDGCGRLRPEAYRPWRAPNRLIRGIMMDQVRSLRFRAVLERRMNHGDAGCTLQIGCTCQEVLRAAGREGEIARLSSQCLSREEAHRATATSTHMRRLSPNDFERLFRHGFEVANYTLYACYPNDFDWIGYTASQCCPTERKRVSYGSRFHLPGRLREADGLALPV